MKHRKLYRYALLALLAFFLLQGLAAGLVYVGQAVGGQTGQFCFRASALLFPLEARPCILGGRRSINRPRLTGADREGAIRLFTRAVGRNVLLDQVHFTLAVLFQQKALDDPRYLARSLRSFLRAAVVNGGQDVTQTTEILKRILPSWGYLSATDRQLYSQLLGRVITRLSRDSFKALLDAWGTHCLDIGFFGGALEKAPQLSEVMADALMQHEIDMELRQSLLADFEAYSLERAQARYRQLVQNPMLGTGDLQAIYRFLRKNVSGYHRLASRSAFDEKEYADFMRRLNLHILQLLFAQPNWQKDPRTQQEIAEFVRTCIAEFPEAGNLEMLRRLLEQQKFFALRSPQAFHCQQLLDFHDGEYSRVIEAIGEYRQSLPFDLQSPPREYLEVMWLLVDAQIESGLLIQALPVLQETERLFPGRTETAWRLMRIEQVVGQDRQMEMDREPMTARVRDSRIIDIGAPDLRQTVFLLGPDPLEFRFAENIRPLLKSRRLLQVFVNGAILHEAYLGRVPPVFTLRIPDDAERRRYVVEVRLL